MITHNLSVVGFIADRIAVMYLGQIVEIGPGERVLTAPAHPYTWACSLRSRSPTRLSDGRHHLLLPGEIPSPRNPPPGCRFHTRCPYAEARCSTDPPVLEEVEPGTVVACHFWRKVRADLGDPTGPPHEDGLARTAT